MLRSLTCFAVGLLAVAGAANSATLVFDTDPFLGTTALTTPGRQIVGAPGTEFTFDPATDRIRIDQGTFPVNPIVFANGLSSSLPASGPNFIVLQNGAPLGAGGAANAIAAQIDTPGAGFFIYFNTVLDLPRLVYSTDLSSADADLAILGRFTNLNGLDGFNRLPSITEANVEAVPEPSSILLTSAGALLVAARAWRQRRSRA